MKFNKSSGLLTLYILSAVFLNGCLPSSTNTGSNPEIVSLTITSPTSLSSIDTVDAAVSVSGTANSVNGILKVSWSNDRGGKGLATGTESWSISNIVLQSGSNVITVTAEDMSSAKASKSLIFNRESGIPGTVTLAWSAPTTRTDGSVLTDLSGYKIFYGRMSGIYDYQIDISNPAILAYVIENLVPGDWYFALTAYDSSGVQSDQSNEVVRNVP